MGVRSAFRKAMLWKIVLWLRQSRKDKTGIKNWRYISNGTLRFLPEESHLPGTLPAHPTLSSRIISLPDARQMSRVRTPSTTSSSPHTYWLALLARKTTGPAKSFGSPHLPAGIRSEICRRRTGSCRSFSFLFGHRVRADMVRWGSRASGDTRDETKDGPPGSGKPAKTRIVYQSIRTEEVQKPVVATLRVFVLRRHDASRCILREVRGSVR